MSISDYAKRANALADDEEALARELDAMPAVECSGIMWSTHNGSPTIAGAVWSGNWEELLSDISAEPWAFQAKVHGCLAGAYAPEKGSAVPFDLGRLVLYQFTDDISRMVQERAA